MFDISVKTSNSYYSTNNLKAITNSIPSSFSTLSYSFSPRTFAAETKLTITIIPTSSNIGHILVTLPLSFTVSALSC